MLNATIFEEDNFFTLNYEWNSPKPNLLYAIVIFNLIVAKEFSNKELENSFKEDVQNDIDILSKHHDFLALKDDEFRKF